MTLQFNDFYNKQMSQLDEFVKKEYYRDDSGRMKQKYKASRPGYRVKTVNGKKKEVAMTSKEKQNRKKAARRGALKRYKKSTTKKTKLVKLG